MRILGFFFSRSSRPLSLILFFGLFILIISVSCGWSQIQTPYPFLGNFGFFPTVNPFAIPSVSRQGATDIIIGREFPPGQVNQENISIYIRSDAPIQIILRALNEQGQMLSLELIPEDGETSYTSQGNRLIIPVGSEKLDGAWHEWKLDAITDLLAQYGFGFAFIGKIEIIGEEFCLGPIIAFTEDGEGITETSYLASFTDDRDNIQDYGWISPGPLTCEFFETLEIETVSDEGYVCLSPGQNVSQIQLPKLPVSFISAPLGLGPFLPVTVMTPTSPVGSFPFMYPPGLVTPRVPSQLYSTPINPGLAFNLLQSIPLYLDAQTGVPYSVNQNVLQLYDPFPTYPITIDYQNDRAYAYLQLNSGSNTPTIETTSVPVPYYR